MRQYIIILVLISSTCFVLCDDAPASKYKCISCNKSPKCAQEPESVSPNDCEKKTIEADCITYIDKKGLTIRACSTGDDDLKDISPNLIRKCNNTSPTSACNNKIFPPDRPTCIISNNNKEVSSPCKIYNEKTECFTVKVNNEVTKGCVGDGDSNDEICTKNKDDCKKCTGNDCNKEPELKCFKCSGNDCKRTSLNCKTISEDKIDGCKSTAGCYTLQQGNEVSRGCLSDLVVQPQGLKTCTTGNSCNGDCITDINKCIKCDSKTNPECGNATVDDKFADQCPPYSTACYYCEDQDGIFHRGCGDPKNGTYSCSYCYQENCKPDKPQRSCLKCDSSKDGFKCVLGDDFTMSARCTEGTDDCAILIKEGTTIRGCAKDVLGEKVDLPKDTYLKCNKHNCNFGVFPADRRRCFQCAKGADCNNDPKGELSKPCLKYDPNEMCYMYSISEEMYRGCKSDKSEQSDGCDTKPSTSSKTGNGICILCDKNDCNRNPYEKPPSLQCIKCKKDDADCIWGQGPEKAVKCEGNTTIKYYESEKCYTFVETNGNKTDVQRGCGLDPEACKKPSTACQMCEGEMCNKKNFMNFTCIRCRSDDPNAEKCANIGDAIAIAPSPCRNQNMQKSEKGCYTENYKGATVRGCFADLDLKRRSICKDEKNHYCNYCEDMNCNNKKVPSSSSINSLSYVFFITSLIAVLLQ